MSNSRKTPREEKKPKADSGIPKPPAAWDPGLKPTKGGHYPTADEIPTVLYSGGSAEDDEGDAVLVELEPLN